MGKKKPRKNMQKKREEKRQKRLRAVKQKMSEARKRQERTRYRPAVADMEAPEGFRAVNISSAMMDFGKPILDGCRGEGGDRLHEATNVIMLIWNYEVALKNRKEDPAKEAEAVRAIVKCLKKSPEESRRFLQEMVERKRRLLPEEIQPKMSMFMYIRKEGEHQIVPFDFDSLRLKPEPLPAEDEDREAVAGLKKMDDRMDREEDYGKWEKDFFAISDLCTERYVSWLKVKCGADDAPDFQWHIELFLDFVYRYGHDDVLHLHSMVPAYLYEFLMDFILRKAQMEPPQFAMTPPALKLFYMFLEEKGYLQDAKPIVKMIEEIEPRFIEVLKERY